MVSPLQVGSTMTTLCRTRGEGRLRIVVDAKRMSASTRRVLRVS